ncbi:MAG: 4a-hydroxytetrahydrobiopterin dehydratase [Pseudomonadota bacterium]
MIPIVATCPVDFSPFDVPAPLKALSLKNALQIDHIDWPHHIGTLLDRVATVPGLKKRPDKDAYPTPSPSKARTQPVPISQLNQILRYEDDVGWELDMFGTADARYLVKTLRVDHVDEASAFTEMIIRHCRVLDHYPEWRNVFNHVTVQLTTWHARRQVTIHDLDLALYMNKAAAVCGAR